MSACSRDFKTIEASRRLKELFSNVFPRVYLKDPGKVSTPGLNQFSIHCSFLAADCVLTRNVNRGSSCAVYTKPEGFFVPEKKNAVAISRNLTTT